MSRFQNEEYVVGTLIRNILSEREREREIVCVCAREREIGRDRDRNRGVRQR